MRYEVGFLVDSENSGLVTYLAHGSGALGPPYQFPEGDMFRQEVSFNSLRQFYNFLTKVEKKIGLDNERVFKLLYFHEYEEGDERA